MDAPISLDDPDSWSAVVEAANPAAVLVAIHSRMGPQLCQWMSAEDVWQETLLRAWSKRASFTWQGTPSFRRWLLSIAEHCIEDHRDHFRAGKRDAAKTRRLDPGSADGSSAGGFELASSTTPSRLAAAAEQARAMQAALASLASEVRDVVSLRLFEELTIAEIAARLQLGESAVRHRFRSGAEVYRNRLRTIAQSSGHAEPPSPPVAG